MDCVDMHINVNSACVCIVVCLDMCMEIVQVWIKHKEAVNVRLGVNHDPIIALEVRVQDRRCAEALRVFLAVLSVWVRVAYRIYVLSRYVYKGK